MDDEISYGLPARVVLEPVWLREQLGSGASIPDIVRQTGYSPAHIRRRIKELGLELPRETPIPSKRDKKVDPPPPPEKFKGIGRDWLEQQLDKGYSVTEIAGQIGYSTQRVYQYIRKYHLRIRKRTDIDPKWLKKQIEKGRSDHDIAQELGVCKDTVFKIRKRYDIPDCRKYRPYQLERIIVDPAWLREQKDLGRSDREIAEELGCSYATVFNRRKRMGIGQSYHKKRLVHP